MPYPVTVPEVVKLVPAVTELPTALLANAVAKSVADTAPVAVMVMPAKVKTWPFVIAGNVTSAVSVEAALAP